MLITDRVEVLLHSQNVPYYEGLGYTIHRRRRSTRVSKNAETVPKGTTLIVKVSDLPKRSHAKVDVLCDYCQKEVVSKTYDKYNYQRRRIKKDCCTKCKGRKTNEYFKKTYGVENNTSLQAVKDKVSEARREDEEIVNEAFKEAKYIKTGKYKNCKTPIDFICTIHPELGVQKTTYSNVRIFQGGCKKCRYEAVTGMNCHFWKGGITDLSNYLRGKILDWRKKCSEQYGNRCVITNKTENIQVHHIHSFCNIVMKTMQLVDIPIYPHVNMYLNDELIIIEEMFKKVHDKYGAGVPINKYLHELYHDEYGKGDNTNLEFDEFKRKYLQGKYDDMLIDRLKSLYVKEKYLINAKQIQEASY
jgi:hypothetical protein